jgi:hypothetical protein
MATRLEDLNINVPPTEEIEQAVAKEQVEQLKVHDGSEKSMDGVFTVADQVDALLEDNPNLEGTKEWMDALSKARATVEQIYDGLPGQSPTEQERYIMSKLERDLLGDIPDNSEHIENAARFSELKRNLKEIFESGEVTNTAAILLLSRMDETIARAVNDTDDVSDEESQKLVSDELIKALMDLYGSHEEMTKSAAALVSTAQSKLVDDLEIELKKLHAVEELLKDITNGSTPVPGISRKRIEIREKLQEEDDYLAAKADISMKLARRDDRNSAGARQEAEEQFAELERSLDQRVEEEIAKLWEELNPGGDVSKAEVLAALYQVRARAELIASSLRKTLSLASGVEETDSYFSVEVRDLLEKTDKEGEDLERILNEAMMIQTRIEEIRASLRSIPNGEMRISYEDLAKTMKDYDFTSGFNDGSGPGAPGGGSTGGGAGTTSSPSPAPAAAAPSAAPAVIPPDPTATPTKPPKAPKTP